MGGSKLSGWPPTRLATSVAGLVGSCEPRVIPHVVSGEVGEGLLMKLPTSSRSASKSDYSE